MAAYRRSTAGRNPTEFCPSQREHDAVNTKAIRANKSNINCNSQHTVLKFLAVVWLMDGRRSRS